MEQRKQLDKLREIQILCHSPMVYRLYKGTVKKLIFDLYECMDFTGSAGLFDVYSVVMRSGRWFLIHHTEFASFRRRRFNSEYEPYPSSSFMGDYPDQHSRRRTRHTIEDYVGGEPIQVHLNKARTDM